jgi:hypothetical protein
VDTLSLHDALPISPAFAIDEELGVGPRKELLDPAQELLRVPRGLVGVRVSEGLFGIPVFGPLLVIPAGETAFTPCGDEGLVILGVEGELEEAALVCG